MSSVILPAAESPHPLTLVPRERPRRKNAARPLTAVELTEWYTWLNSAMERRRLAIAQSASLPRSIRRLMRVRAQSAYVMRGIAWWQGMTLRERLEALRAADTACPAQAWHYRESIRRPVSNVARIMEVSHV